MSTRTERTFVNKTRKRIKAAKLVHRLLKFVDGEAEMSPQQTKEALSLLDKELPTLKSVEIDSIEAANKTPREMTRAEIDAEICELNALPRGTN